MSCFQNREPPRSSDGLLTYEELVYWQDHFKLPDHEAGLTPQVTLKKASRRSLSDNEQVFTNLIKINKLTYRSRRNSVG